MPDVVLQGETHHMRPDIYRLAKALYGRDEILAKLDELAQAATLKGLAGDDMLLHVMQEVYKGARNAKVSGWRKI
nr:hypothetical protein [uncultured Pseudodesulfovibrio sp.]